MENIKSNGQSVADPGELENLPGRNCIGIQAYLDLTSLERKTKWLRDYGKDVCEDILYETIIQKHLIPDPGVVKNAPGESLSMRWDAINNFIGTSIYNAYFSFDFDSKKNITGMKMIPLFRSDIPCYSLPLLRCIAKKHGLKNDSIIQFKNGIVKTVLQTVVIVVDNKTYYDYSDEPSAEPRREAI